MSHFYCKWLEWFEWLENVPPTEPSTARMTRQTMSRIRWQGSTGQFLILQDTTRYAVRLELTYCQLCSIEGKREEKCASHYHGRKNFWFSTIFLDRDGHMHCRTMDEKYGLPFVPKCKRAEESHTCPFVFFLSYLQENGEIQNFVTMATLHSVSSRLTYLSSWLFNALHLLCVVFLTKSCQTNSSSETAQQFQAMNTFLTF